MLLALSIFFELVYPNQSFALTGGPAQPEFNSFTPIGTSDMVDLSSGDMSYNIPLMDVGGYPLNIAYSGGITMDQEASWVGLGWNLSVGQINRNVRGIPDDFDGDKGDELTYENYMKPNVTVGASFNITPNAFGVKLDGATVGSSGGGSGGVSTTIGVSASYNNYTGFSMRPSVGMNFELSKNVSVGFNASSGPDGLSVSPNVSLHGKKKAQDDKTRQLGASFGVSMNSRQGLTSTSLSMTNTSTYDQTYKKKGKKDKTHSKKGSESIGSSIGFTDQLYTPTKRVGMSTRSFTVNAALGTEIFGAEGQGQITAYGTIMKVADDELNKTMPAYGYANTEKAEKDGVLDFNREKDGAFSVNSTNLPITNYTYDIYSVQGQGVSGMYRPFRNQVGYVFDAQVKDGSESFALGVEAGLGNAVHLGVDFEATLVDSRSGMWEQGNYMLPYLKEGNHNASIPEYEKVHYKNVGDLSADYDFDGMFAQTGNYDPTRVAWNVNGMKFNRIAQNIYKNKTNGNGNENQIMVGSKIHRSQRQMRNQAIVHLTIDEIYPGDKDYGIGYGPCVKRNQTSEYNLPSEAKGHHVGEVQIIRNDGARYIYGLPVYNKTKVEKTFAVEDNGDCQNGLVYYTPSDVSNPENLPNDQFLDGVTTPGYAHTHLLTSVLSTDYQDLTNDGPTADDFGSYTKFSYQKVNDNYKWRVPFQENMATYNEGLKTDGRDQRGNYVYGEKEQYLIQKIETKTHIAIFHHSARKDAHGVSDENGGIDENADSYKLDKISLYSIEEYDPLDPDAIPIKEVHFVYDYELCKGATTAEGVPNNELTQGISTSLTGNELTNQGGKLTLKRIYFTYRNSKMGKYTDYEFTYGFNPSYNIKGYDSWGNYKPNSGTCANTSSPLASEYPFTEQDKSIQDEYSQAWCLTEIKLPSGGSIDVTYESDDYLYVQNKEAMRMFKVVGAGDSQTPSVDGNKSAELYGDIVANGPKRYLYIAVDDNSSLTATDYLEDLEEAPIYFRFLMNLTQMGGGHVVGGTASAVSEDIAKYDYVTGYLQYRSTDFNTDGYDGNAAIFDGPSGSGYRILSLPVEVVKKEGGLFNSSGLTNNVHPISKATWHFGRKYLNQHVYSNQPNGDTGGGTAGEEIEAIATDMLSPSVLNNLIEIFTGPNATLENKNVGRRFIKQKSWVRLNNPNNHKLGGGNRVKSIRMSDVWEEMNPGQGDYQTMNYGQSYTYTLPNGASSGVATYEPVGNKENPFVQPVFSSTKHLLAPDEENYIEKPFGESFFPNPTVTYSRVSVANLVAGDAPAGTNIGVKRLHRTGHVVTEFYTSKDYPTIVDQTIMEAKEDKQEALANLLNLYTRQHFTASQGYTIHLNDMNGKQKAQWVYAEGQSAPISGVKYLYDNHETPNNFSASGTPGRAKGRLNNNVVVIRPDGTVGRETIGVEVDVVNDFRENHSYTSTSGINANLATFFVGIIPGMVPIPLPDISVSEDKFRSVSTTKVINTFGILKETIAYDAGASVSTKNLAWDASTGEVLLTETVDEFSDKYYTLNYPAHWYYEGMAQAARNIQFEGVLNWSSSTGGYTITGISNPSNYLLPGDELYIKESMTNLTDYPHTAWVKEIQGNTVKLIKADGDPISGAFGSGASYFKVTRSGHRNLQSAGIMNVTLMRNPLTETGTGDLISHIGGDFLRSTTGWEDWKIINAGAVDYSDAWEPPCECETDVSSGIYNPYTMNAKGVWRTKSSRTYLTGRNYQSQVTPRVQGFFTSFLPMYQRSNYGFWMKDFTDWTFVAEVTEYSPYGFELENRDALDRHSAAQYGYNNTFPMAVGANAKYSEIGYDGFEDYGFEGCDENGHFTFNGVVGESLNTENFHTGKHSMKVSGQSVLTLSKTIGCPTEQEPEP